MGDFFVVLIVLPASIATVADHRTLFDFLSDLPPLQSKYHIPGAFKKAFAFFPTHATPAMLQADKLLLHFPATVWTNFVAHLLFLFLPQFLKFYILHN